MRDFCYWLGLILLALYLYNEHIDRINGELRLQRAVERIEDLEQMNKLHGWGNDAFFDTSGWYAA